MTSVDVRCFHSVVMESDLHASDPATIDLLAMMVAFLRPRIVVEAGTYHGHTALALANIMRDMGIDGKVYTADALPMFQRTLERPEVAPLRPYLHFHHGDFLDMLTDVPGLIDLAYIDASAKDDASLRYKHFRGAFERMAPNGLIFIDDTASQEWDDAAWFRARSNLYLTDHRGLAVFQRRGGRDGWQATT